MSDINSVTIIGRLTEKPVARYTQSGTAVTTLNIANNSFVKKPDGGTEKKANFFKVTVWGKTAENCGQYLDKGSQVGIQGRLEYRVWQTKDGDKRNSVEIVATNVQFLGKPKAQESSSYAPPEQLDVPPSPEESLPESPESQSESEDFSNPLDDEEVPF